MRIGEPSMRRDVTERALTLSLSGKHPRPCISRRPRYGCNAREEARDVTQRPAEIEDVRASRARYRAGNDPGALAESIRLGREALARLSGSGALEGSAALELAASLGELYQETAQLRHLDEELILLERARQVLPAGHLDLLAVYTNIAGARLHRFGARRDPEDLAAAVGAARRAVDVSAPGDARRAIRYGNLTGVLRTQYQESGDPALLDESISAGRAGIALLEPNTQEQCLILATLAGSLRDRALLTGSTSDLAESIEIARQAVTSASHASAWRPAAVSTLASGLRLRFDMTSNMADLSEAIALHREMTDLVPSQHAEHSAHLLNAASTLMTRFERLRVDDDLDNAEQALRRILELGNASMKTDARSMLAACLQHRSVRLAAGARRAEAKEAALQAVDEARRALDETDPAANSYPGRLIQVCNSTGQRLHVTRTEADRAEAIVQYQDAIHGLAAYGEMVALCTLNLGRIYLLPTESGPPNEEDIDKAAGLFRSVLGMPESSQRINAWAALGLLEAGKVLFRGSRDRVDLNEVVCLYWQLAHSPAAPPRIVAQAGNTAGALLMGAGASEEAAPIFADAVLRLPAVAWRGIDRKSRESQLADLSELGCDAAASQLAAGNVDAAVEAVEHGRNVLWADMLQLRHGDADLWQDQPEHAARLRDLAAALGEQLTVSGDHGTSRAVDQRMAHAVEWEQIVAQIRGNSGDHFLQPARLAELLPAAAYGPVVIVNVSPYRCDALIITTAGARALALPLLSANDVIHNTDRYLSAHDRFSTSAARVRGAAPGSADSQDAQRELQAAHSNLEASLVEILGWLWDTTAEPVLSALGFTSSPEDGQPWNRMWWCPTGLLTLLPLHAAGHHTAVPGSPPRTVLDRVVSSYTPTLTALTSARRAPSRDENRATMLAVGMPDTPDADDLPSAGKDRQLLVRKLGDRCRVVYGKEATTSVVEAELPLHQWAHFSCHGRQNLATPSAGGLRLYDKTLAITDISAARCAGEFAFLSACQTATGGTTLPNEALSLAASLHYAGYRHVIATLSSVYDEAAAQISERIYTDLIHDGYLASARSAIALHDAIRTQRDGHLATPSWWVPFVHVGP